MIVARFGVAHRFLRIALGAIGVAAAYRYELPLGLLGLLLVTSGVAGWCSLCEAADAADRRLQRRAAELSGPGPA